jgi:hypothetical protein
MPVPAFAGDGFSLSEVVGKTTVPDKHKKYEMPYSLWFTETFSLNKI